MTERFQQFQFTLRRQPPCCQRRTREVTAGTSEKIDKDHAIGPFEVECQHQGFPDPYIRQFVPANIEHQGTLKPGSYLGVVLIHDQPGPIPRGNVVRRPPPVRVHFRTEVQQPFEKGFEGDGFITVYVVANEIEVVPPLVDS